ncbi:hypothetical protein AGLY_004149 [Aphis glycines]|uniref:Uncharacterized protein n=1 Tax=Aphis glycines TaxID=307491 RepID=A0A6G0TXS1_APHGL|nr:hypothetical protein AGLY_004149 [Aphis glycines]
MDKDKIKIQQIKYEKQQYHNIMLNYVLWKLKSYSMLIVIYIIVYYICIMYTCIELVCIEYTLAFKLPFYFLKKCLTNIVNELLTSARIVLNQKFVESDPTTADTTQHYQPLNLVMYLFGLGVWFLFFPVWSQCGYEFFPVDQTKFVMIEHISHGIHFQFTDPMRSSLLSRLLLNSLDVPADDADVPKPLATRNAICPTAVDNANSTFFSLPSFSWESRSNMWQMIHGFISKPHSRYFLSRWFSSYWSSRLFNFAHSVYFSLSLSSVFHEFSMFFNQFFNHFYTSTRRIILLAMNPSLEETVSVRLAFAHAKYTIY